MKLPDLHSFTMDACFVSWVVNAGVQENTEVTGVNMLVLEMG